MEQWHELVLADVRLFDCEELNRRIKLEFEK
jgi:hypothetical protein